MKINNKKCKDILELINIAEEKFGDDVNIDLSEDNINININLKGNKEKNNNIITARKVLTKKKSFNEYSWDEIDTISKSGKAREYFNIGDEKKLVINEFDYEIYDYKTNKKIKMTHPETIYSVQIIGFDHDNIDAFSKQKVGITFLLKETLLVEYMVNPTATNIGGWKESKIRTFLNNDIYNALPSDLQQVIKVVEKDADTGCKDFWFRVKDKLFLLSTTDIGIKPSHSIDTRSEIYKYFIDNDFKNKDNIFSFNNSWWLRSTCTKNKNSFFYMKNNGEECYDDANKRHNIVFAFCI